MQIKGALFSILTAVSGLCLAGNTYYVDPEHGDDGAAGDAEHPRQTLVGVMELVTPNNGDIVYAAPGFYTNKTVEVDGINYRVSVPAGTTLKSTGTRANTFIIGAGDPDYKSNYGCGPKAVRCAYLAANAKIDGFTITGGRGYYTPVGSSEVPGGVVGADRSTCFVYNSTFTNLVTNCRAAAMFKVKAVGCYFANNRANGGVADSFQSETVYNCVFGATYGYHGYYNAYFYNCTFFGDAARYSFVYNTLIFAKQGGQNSYYNCRHTVDLETTTIESVDTEKVLAADVAYDPVTYVPLPGSLAIDCGNNSRVKPSLDAPYGDYHGNPRIYNDTVDIGAVEARAAVIVSDVAGLDLTGITGGVTPIPPGGLHATIARNYKTTLKVRGIRVNGGELFEFEGETADRVWEGDFVDGEDVSIEVVYVDKNDWYVDAVHGNDANDGYTPYRARKTLVAAMALPHLKSGEIVHAAAGTYDEGEVWNEGSDEHMYGSNRVAVVAGVGLVATNADVTIIKGRPHNEANPTGNGKAAVRCVFLNEGSWIENFTITNGFSFGKWGSQYAGYGGGILSMGGAAIGCRIVRCGSDSWGHLVYGGTLIRCMCDTCDLVYANKHVAKLDAFINSVFKSGSVEECGFALNSTIEGSVRAMPAYNSYVYYDVGGASYFNCRLYYDFKEGGGSTADNASVIGIYKKPVCDANYRPARTDTLYCDTGSRELYDTYFPAKWIRFKGKDFAGGQRVYNGKIDIGAGEADWRSVYTTALGAKRTTVLEAGPGVTAGELSLNLEDGDSLVLRLEPKVSGEGSVTVVSEGDVTVTCGGQVAVKTGDVYTFKAGEGLADVTISVTGGSAVVSNVRLPGPGLLLLLR